MREPLISIAGGVARHPLFRLSVPLHFTLFEGDRLAIVGPNGAGKSLLVDMILGAHPLLDFVEGKNVAACWNVPYTDIALISFRDAYGDALVAYHQQRWNKWDQPQAPTVSEALAEVGGAAGADEMRICGMERLANQPLTLLSSGELRKFRILKALRQKPRVLILDNPYIGLDSGARAEFTDMLSNLGTHLALVVVVSRESDIPPFTTHIVRVGQKEAGERRVYVPARPAVTPSVTLPAADLQLLHTLAASGDVPPQANEVVRLADVSVSYDGHTILQPLTWCMRAGEHWAVSGPNGAGKSTLLSLICADNPQAYALNVSLFGRRRGSGESIWDIKRHIGYVSPELARVFRSPHSVVDVVCSGHGVSSGLHHRATPAQAERAAQWLALFGIYHLAQRPFTNLSSGEQRMVLLARAFVKSPSLLVLDEPFHGLDDCHTARARAIIDAYSALPRHSLIFVSHYRAEYPAVISHELVLQVGAPATQHTCRNNETTIAIK